MMMIAVYILLGLMGLTCLALLTAGCYLDYTDRKKLIQRIRSTKHTVKL